MRSSGDYRASAYDRDRLRGSARNAQEYDVSEGRLA